MKWVNTVSGLAMMLAIVGCGGGDNAAGSSTTIATSSAPTDASATRSATRSAGPGVNGGNREDLLPAGYLARSLPEIAAAIADGSVSAEALVSAYLERIDMIDKTGPTLNSIISLNPDALEQARALDAARANGDIKGPLHGVPILLKDNIESADNMPTTAGALVLKDNVTGRDSPLAAGLREQGAIILGKTNLSQWANFRSQDSMSGWSALGGQVKNPHMLDRNPCGSSSGTGAAIAASLAAGGVGTETNGSIICPSNVNGIVGFKPTVGLVPQDLIVPISSSQDTAGPMTKTVRGAAMMLTAMARGGTGVDYAAGLDANALSGLRVGVMNFARGGNGDITAAFDQALADLEAAGAVLVEIDDFEPAADGFFGKAYDVLKYEFKATLNDYLANAAPAVEARTLSDVIAFNKEHAAVELALFDQSIMDQSVDLGPLTDDDYTTARDAVQAAARKNGIDRLLTENNVEVLVGPSGVIAPRVDPINGDVWPQWAGAGYLAAIAGYPNLTVPMGNVHGLPIGISFMASGGEDAKVLSIGYAYEQATSHRIDPTFLPSAEARPEIGPSMGPAIVDTP